MTLTNITFKGRGGNVIGSLGSGSLVQDMPTGFQINNTSGINEGSYVKCGDHTYTGDMTWSVWAYLDSGYATGGNNYPHICSKEGSWFMLQYGESLYFALTDSAGNEYSDSSLLNNQIAFNQWNHIGCTWNSTSGDLVFYLNGVSGASAASSCVTAVGDTSNEVMLGARKIAQQISWDGSLRDIRIYNSVLSETDMEKVFLDTYTGSTPLNHWQMEDGSSTTIDDTGSLNMDGTITGTSGYTAEGTGWKWNKSLYNLNQIGLGSVSGSATVSGGTWNLKNSTYLRPTGTNNSNANYVQFNDDQQLDGSRSYAMWFYLSSKTSTQVMLSNYNSSNEGTQIFLNGGTTNLYLRLNNSNVNYITANENEWNHLVWTIDETNNLAKGYLNGIEVTSSANDRTYGTVENMRLGADVKAEYPVNDGNYFSEYAYYTSVLTPVQVDLIYRGNWTGGPNTWIKLDEGTGTSVTNHGTSNVTATLTGSGSTTPAWVNPTYTKGGAGTSFTNDIYITSGTSISAPRGIFDWTSDASFVYFKVDNPDTTTTWIHNSGTLAHSGGNNKNFNLGTSAAGSGATFYNVSSSSMLSFGYGTAEVPNNWWIENEWKLDSTRNGVYNGTNSPIILTLGTNTTSGSILEGSLGTQDGGDKRWTIQAKNELFPVHMDTTFYCYNGGNTLTLKDVNWASANNFGDGSYGSAGNTVNVVISGNVEFAGEVDLVDTTSTGLNHLTVSNDSRAKFGGNLDMDSDTTFVGSGALIICDDKIKTDGASVYNSGTSVICGHAGTSTIRFNSGDWENLMYNPTGGGVCFDTNANVANNLIVAGGYYDMQTAHLSGGGVGKLQIATGGEFRGGDGTNHLITDTFNQAGGFIGQGAYTGDGANDNFMQIWNSDISDLEFGTGSLTVEAWVKASAAGGLIGSYWGSDLPMYQLDIGSGTATNMRILATGAGGASTDGLTQVDAPATTNVIDGKWHHVVGVRDTSAGLVKLYIDGKLESESSDAATVAEGGDTDNGQRKMVGSRGYYGELDGEIARASYWKVALTEAEIREMLFYDWVAVSGSSIDHTKCVGWYEFSDRHTQTSVTDMTGSGNTGTLSSTDLWAVGGTFTDDTCTLEFDNDGSLPNTYNFFMPRDGTQAEYWGITVTTDSALAIDNLDGDRDVKMYGPLVNSGATLTNRRNFQYYNSTGPVVDASSDLTVGNNTFYYFPSSAGSLQDAAGTTYSLFRPGNGADVTMQGDFTTTNGLGIYSDSVLHLNGYKGNIDKIQTYNSGNLVLDPGSTINFTNTNGFLKDEGGSNRSYITASGTNALLPNGNTPSRGNYFYTNAGPSTADGGAFGDSGSRKMSISMWFKTRRDANDADFGNNECVYGGNRGSSGEGSPQFTNYNATTLECRMHTSDPGGGGLGRAADVSIGSLSLDTWYHLVFTSEETGGNVVQNMYIHNADGTIFNTDTATGSGKTWYISSSYPAWWIWGKDNRGTGNSYYMGHGMAMADVRLYDAILTSGNSDTLSTECPNISPSYADSDNALGAITQWKLGPTVAPYQTSSYTDSVGSVTLTPAGNGYGDANYKQPKSGFATVTGSAGYKPMNNPYEIMTLTNTYMSGSQDIIVGRYMANTTPTANTNAKLITKGTVVLD